MEREMEEKVRQKGLAIFEAISGEIPSFFDSSRWKGRIMEWAMKNEHFKVQLFRFIDTLPSLSSDRKAAALLAEYMNEYEDTLPENIKRWMPKKGLLGALAGKAIKKNVEALASQFIAGQTPGEALRQVAKLRKEGRTFSADLLGEAVLSDQEAYLFTERYLELVDTLAEMAEKWPDDSLLDCNGHEEIPKVDISFKVSSFYSRLDPMAQVDSIGEAKKNLRLLFDRAIEKGCSLTFDMEHYQLKNLTLAVFKSILDEYPDYQFAGIAIQSYLLEAESDLKELAKWAKKDNRTISVRLVKGAYWDYEKVVNVQAGWPLPVHLEKTHTDHNFEKLTRFMLENSDCIRPAIASHNIRSIAYAMTLAEELGHPKEWLEFQALYGMAEPIKKAVAGMGYRVREYMPVGEFLPGMAYLVRRLLENTSNESFLRLSFADRKDFDSLMIEPEECPAEWKPEKSDFGFSNLPLLNFSKKENREAFGRALKSVRESIGKENRVPCIIGSDQFFTEREIISYNPANSAEIVGVAAAASAGETEKAVNEAVCAGRLLSETPVAERADCLKRAAQWIVGKRCEIAALQILEVGKGWREADADVAEAVDFLNFYAEEMIKLSKTQRLGRYPGELNHQSYIPKGVAVVIAPWNFPLAIACGMTAAALVTGNSVILKPSSLSPLTAFKIFEAFEAAGLPKGALQFLPGPGGEIGERLVGHNDVDIISFTGSMEVGLRINEIAGKTAPGQRNAKKVISEMGGKNAIIIDETADLDEAIKGVISSFTGFQGQKCSACSRVIVIKDVMEDFLGRLTEAVKSITIGAPGDPANIMGPLIDDNALEKVRNYIDIGKKEAKLVWQSDFQRDDGYFVAPAIFRDVSPDSRIATEEIFGPVLSVIGAKDFDEALEVAGATPYALTGGIYSRSPVNIRKGEKRFLVGNLYINRQITGALVGRQPFGGFGMSGMGTKAGGSDYLLHFMNPRCVTENTLRRGFAPE